eukprot:CAMPEP_0201215518 /NCGR_PEP_ID=MMETSP0851-20130426/189009_1 /ASSEMBLY_ACC=CAM_ASM_000631 /TAXON_ID=183588 /ORGANISM="Pseudo-nitzschia fraudulenta, Strain WWA7" /LENGTH=210 /DNA_ID=CAMNT_0047504991 /DNA_START=917 /DNA_END=1547 /DNA_ORIENTATION=-
MSEDHKDFTKVTPGRGKKTNIVTPNSKHPTKIPKYQSKLTAQATLFPTTEPIEEDWVDINMRTNNLIKRERLLPERKPRKQATTKNVITFKRELITALKKCPDHHSDQGYAYIIETEEEYQPGLFHDNGIPYMQHHRQHEITLTAPTGENIPISPNNVYTPCKNLGHYKAPGGNYLSQKEAILKKAGASQEPAGLKQPYSTSDGRLAAVW